MSTKKTLKIAIDGPSGAGKSSLAKNISKELGIRYLDTGALYRTVGLYVKRCGKKPDSADEVEALLPNIVLSLRFEDTGGETKQIMILNGEDVTNAIRDTDISMYASAVSAIPAVRKFLLGIQRSVSDSSGVVIDGRDIGTVILPDADVKIFLTASNEERAERRYMELKSGGRDIDYEKVLSEMNKRDADDSGRDISPAVPADDAVILNNSGFTKEQTLKKALEIIYDKVKNI